MKIGIKALKLIYFERLSRLDFFLTFFYTALRRKDYL